MSLKETHKYFSSRKATATSQDRCGFWVFPSTSFGVASVADGSLTGHHTAVISSLARGCCGKRGVTAEWLPAYLLSLSVGLFQSTKAT